MAGLTHEHRESTDPRNAGFCPCGHRMFRARDTGLERETVLEACYGRVSPDVLIEHAQTRADQYGRRLRVGVDWLKEALDELPDFTNYVTWDLEEHFDQGHREELMEALALAAEAYERVRLVRQQRRLG